MVHFAPHASYRPYAHYATPSSYPEYRLFMTPTELGNVFFTMTHPHDNSWYMNSGATSHMTHSSSTLMPLFNLSTQNYILVGSGYRIPVLDYGQSPFPAPHPPLALRDVLFALNYQEYFFHLQIHN